MMNEKHYQGAANWIGSFMQHSYGLQSRKDATVRVDAAVWAEYLSLPGMSALLLTRRFKEGRGRGGRGRGGGGGEGG